MSISISTIVYNTAYRHKYQAYTDHIHVTMLRHVNSHRPVVSNALKDSQNLTALELRKLTVRFKQSCAVLMLCSKGHHRISPILRVSKFRQQRDALKQSHQTLFFNHECGEGSVPSLRRTDIPSYQLASNKDWCKPGMTNFNPQQGHITR